jgi:hypothetical protein
MEETIKYLQTELKESDSFKYCEMTTEDIGYVLCGENWELAKEPFSEEFLCNVAYNNTSSYQAVILLQLWKLWGESEQRIYEQAQQSIIDKF